MQYGRGYGQGTERYIIMMADGLRERGHDVAVLGGDPEHRGPELPLGQPLDGEPEVLYYPTHGWTSVHGVPPADLKPIIERESPDIIHVVNPGHIGIGLMLAGGLLLSLGQAPLWTALVLLFSVLASVAAVGANGDRTRAVLYFGWVVVAGWGLIELRAGGMAPVFWLIGVVVATDIAGYFFGRMLGGPKFWPKVSPKKTWSGTVAGWVAAAIVGWLFVPALGAGIIWLSVIVSFASQMGDAAESALKRAKGVKDVSALIPGHGGVFDRFDAIMGAAFVVTLARLASLGG